MSRPAILSTILRGNDPEQAARAATALWQMWHQSGDPKLDALLLEGIEAMQRHELREADEVFTRLIETAPRFAGNKRATALFALISAAQSERSSPLDRGNPHRTRR